MGTKERPLREWQEPSAPGGEAWGSSPTHTLTLLWPLDREEVDCYCESPGCGVLLGRFEPRHTRDSPSQPWGSSGCFPPGTAGLCRRLRPHPGPDPSSRSKSQCSPLGGGAEKVEGRKSFKSIIQENSQEWITEVPDGKIHWAPSRGDENPKPQEGSATRKLEEQTQEAQRLPGKKQRPGTRAAGPTDAWEPQPREKGPNGTPAPPKPEPRAPCFKATCNPEFFLGELPTGGLQIPRKEERGAGTPAPPREAWGIPRTQTRAPP